MLIFSIFCVSGIDSAEAIYDGEPADGDQLVTAMYKRGCSAAVIAPRIIALAQHCLGASEYIVSPGTNKYSNTKYSILKAFIPSGNLLGGREYDFMLSVMDRELPVSNKLQIATEQDISRWKTNKTNIVIYGYGETKLNTESDTPNKASFYISPLPDITNGVSPSYTSVISLNPVNGTSTVCNGDSGGPSYVFEGDKIYYLGASIASNKMGGCGIDSNTTTIVRIQAMYPYMNLLDQANDWIDKNIPKPVVIQNVTIRCKKGKITKKISGVAPTCPKGYKKQNS